ncbi:MAG: MFS transporter [Candidatus Bathyarchaeia archaeon]
MHSKHLSFDKSVIILFMVFLLSSISTNLTSPIWPLYINSLGASVTELGFVVALSNTMAAVIPIVSGPLSDKYGRKKMNVVGAFLAIFPPLFYTFAKSWHDLIPWVLIAGVATGLYLPSRWTIIADYSTAKKRAMAYSWMNIAYLLGSTIAPFIGGLIADITDIHVPFILCFALTCLCFVFSLLLRETSNISSKKPILLQDRFKTQPFFIIALIFLALNLIQGVGIGIYGPITPIFMEKQFMVDYTGIGILYAIGFGISSMIVQIPGGKMAAKYSKKKILFVTTILSSPFFSLFALSRSFLEAIVLMFLSNFILNFSWPSFQALTMELTSSTRWGLMNGLIATAFWLGMSMGSAISGMLWETFGMFFPYYVSAVMVLLSTLPVLYLKETENKTEL